MSSRTFIGTACILVFASACGAQDSTDPDPMDPVGTSEDDLSFRERCESVSADATVVGRGDVFSNTRNYDHSGCRNAFVVDLVDSNPGTGNGDDIISFYWGEPPPETQEHCERAHTIAYSWDSAGNGVDARLSYAQWFVSPSTGTFVCSNPIASFWHPTPGSSMRFAVSARQGWADGSYTKRRVVGEF